MLKIVGLAVMVVVAFIIGKLYGFGVGLEAERYSRENRGYSLAAWIETTDAYDMDPWYTRLLYRIMLYGISKRKRQP